MHKLLPVLFCVLSASLLGGCGRNAKSSYIVGTDIQKDDVSEFYWTKENINFDAHYQRYHFYLENGTPMFHHETRHRENEYGPTTEKDITASGTFALSDEEWDAFFALLQDGTAAKRGDSAESGGEGPWTFLYWNKDKGEYQEYTFPDYGRAKEFVGFCESLAKSR